MNGLTLVRFSGLWKYFCYFILFTYYLKSICYVVHKELLEYPSYNLFSFKKKKKLFDRFKLCLQIKPLVGPTQAIMSVHINTYQWHEFFPRGKPLTSLVPRCSTFMIPFYVIEFLHSAARSNIGVVIALWAPIILVTISFSWFSIIS